MYPRDSIGSRGTVFRLWGWDIGYREEGSMSIHSVSTSTGKETGRTNTPSRKVLSTGEYAALPCTTVT